MSNRLEQFVKQHREAFDSEEPPSFSKLSIGKPKAVYVISKRSTMMAAAAILILLLSSGIYFLDFNRETSVVSTSEVEQKELIKEIDPVKAKTVEHFTALIEKKQDEIKSLQKLNPQLYREFSKSMQDLDSVYNQLQVELSETPNHEVLLEAMIQNLQLQTTLLTRQLEIIQNLKQKAQQNESKTI